MTNFKLSEHDRVMDTNLRSAVYLSTLAVPHLEKTKGNIVNVSSVTALTVMPNLISYSMAKAALNQFTKCAAVDLASKGIRVNSVNPAVIKTPLFEAAFGMTKDQADQFCDDYGKTYLVGRYGEVEDTSYAKAYIANDKASFLTGIILPVDGGCLTGCRQVD